MAYNAVSVGDTATLIVAANTRRKSVHIVNNSSSVVFIGPDTSITTSNAIPMYEYTTRDQSKIPEGYQGPIYGIVASGTANVRYWEVENA